MPPINQRPLAELSLDLPFPTPTGSTPPLDLDNPVAENKPTPGIPLFEPSNPADRPRILIVDDKAPVLTALLNSLQGYAKALDVHVWQAGVDDKTLLEHLDALSRAPPPWQPQVIVLDIHLEEGTTSLEYLKALRDRKGLASVAVVLATADHKKRLDHNYQAESSTAAEWLSQAKAYEPEFVLYGKEGSRTFLARIGESASTWIQAARRRAWQKLLETVAEKLDGKLETDEQVEALGKLICDYAHDELDVDEAFIRWRKNRDKYSLIAHSGETQDAKTGDKTTVADVPLLKEMLDHPRRAVIKAKLEADELGRFQQVSGYRFLGIGTYLNDRPYGFIALYRKQVRAEFDPEIDGKQLEILGRLLAAALGRATTIKRSHDRQHALLNFAQTLAQARSEDDVYWRLAEFLHKEVHGSKDDRSKVAIALVSFESGVLECSPCTQGLPTRDCNLPIFVKDDSGVCAKVIQDKTAILIDDVTAPKWQKIYVEATPNIRSELCVPLLIADAAIGVVNLEHQEIGRYKASDQNFVQSAVNLACQLLDNLRTSHFADEMLEFAETYTNLTAQQAEDLLRNKLYSFCRFSALAIMEPSDPSDLTKAWQLVGDVDLRLHGGNLERIADSLKRIDDWEHTWLYKLCTREVPGWQNEDGASFTNDPNDFQPIDLLTQNGQQVGQKADAILWLRDGNAPPHRAMLLLWVFPPPIAQNDIRALGRFARLFSSLESQQERVSSLRDEVMMKEQAAAMGHVMQHFRHRLVNETGAMSGLVDQMERDLDKHDCDRMGESLARLKNSVQKTAESFDKAQGYVKAIKPQSCFVREIFRQARDELKNKLTGIDWQDGGVPTSETCWTDPIIAGLILYSLIENAADALKNTPNPQIRLSTHRQDGGLVLRVEDNGRGIPEGNRKKLFTFGFTTKSDSLGSALAFARLRATQLRGDLRLAPKQPTVGTAFELWLPTDKASLNNTNTAKFQ